MNRCLRLTEPSKKFAGCCARRRAQLFQGAALDLGGRLGNLSYVRRFASFAAIRHRGQKWAIRFQHELLERSRGHGLANIFAVFERQNACEADQRTQFNDLSHLRRITRETMEHAANLFRKWAKLRDRVVKTITLM